MRITLTRPVSRFKLFAAKVSAIGIFILANLGLLLVLSLIVGLIFSGDSMSLKSVLQVILAYGVSFFPLFVLALGVVLLANIFKSGTSVFFVTILAFILFKGAGVFFSQYSGVLLTSYFDWYNLWLAASLPLMKILREFLMLLGYGLLFFTGAYYLFDKKEF
jgi:ABC-2 type transport system permease protein